MRPSYLLPILMFAAAIAGIGSAQAQTVVIEDDFAAPPVLAPAVPAIVPAAPYTAPGVVVVRRPPIVAAPVVVAPRAPLFAAERVVVAPIGCAYGYGYC
jgi:hypothetical protein